MCGVDIYLYFSIIHDQQEMIRQKDNDLLNRQRVIESQNQICIQLIEEINRVRAVVSQMQSLEVRNILQLIEQVSHNEENNNLLISASQILQTISDEHLSNRIAMVDNMDAQRLIYVELLVSRFIFYLTLSTLKHFKISS